MKVSKSPGGLLLAIYLILTGLVGVFGVNLGRFDLLLPILAMISGVLLLMGL